MMEQEDVSIGLAWLNKEQGRQKNRKSILVFPQHTPNSICDLILWCIEKNVFYFWAKQPHIFALGHFLSLELSEKKIIYSLQRERLVNFYLFSCSIRDHLKYIGASMIRWSVSKQSIKDSKNWWTYWEHIVLITFQSLW